MAPELNILIANSHINLTLDMYFNFSKTGGACLLAITVEVILFFEKRYCKKKKRFKELYWIFSFNMENPKTSFKQGRRKKKKKGKRIGLGRYL